MSDRWKLNFLNAPLEVARGRLLDLYRFSSTDTCPHDKHVPAFDQEAAKGLTTREVQERWPRFDGVCGDCGGQVIVYASFGHYLSGDW